VHILNSDVSSQQGLKIIHSQKAAFNRNNVNTHGLPTQSEEELAEKLRECVSGNNTMQSSVTEFNVELNSQSIISIDNINI
jgi:hypothetical protein